jgi:hypothetical protein
MARLRPQILPKRQVAYASARPLKDCFSPTHRPATPYICAMPDDLFTIVPRHDLGILVARWSDDAPFAQLQASYEELLKAGLAHGLPRWLLDVRRRDQLDPAFGQWTTHVFYADAATRLAPQPLRVAILCSPVRLAVYEADAAQQQYLAYGLSPERNYQLQLFIEEGPAMQWLTS